MFIQKLNLKKFTFIYHTLIEVKSSQIALYIDDKQVRRRFAKSPFVGNNTHSKLVQLKLLCRSPIFLTLHSQNREEARSDLLFMSHVFHSIFSVCMCMHVCMCVYCAICTNIRQCIPRQYRVSREIYKARSRRK